ncbi:MAG TPA: CCA tRNA nucleotidyltransferase, partial [Smithella sp.]|nr:CCA tRNA nucleotidyltransferase [Smithella sp.]
ASGHEAYFVGGCVRDSLRGVTPGDYDIVTSAPPEEICQIFPRAMTIGAKFGVVAVIMDGHPYEVATFRSDELYEDGRHPSRVRFTSAREDVQRRDFTVNGLLMNPETREIIDYVNGQADIKQKIIRTIGDPDRRFQEDFLRMLRAVRFAANLDFSLDKETQNAIQRNASRIRQVSAERIQEELNKILTRGGARRGFELLETTGVLQVILPEVAATVGVEQPPRFHPEGDVWQHILRMLELLPTDGETSSNICLAWGALLHDIGKAVTRSEDERGIHFYGHVQKGEALADAILQRLRFSRAHRETVLSLIRQHMVFMNVQDMRPGRLKRFLRMPDFHLHLELHRLDCLASHGMLDHYEFCRRQLEQLGEEDLHPVRLLSGHDLKAMGFAPGKLLGEILQELETQQLEGKIKTAREAKDFVLSRWKPAS